MAIVTHLDVMLAIRKMPSKELASRIDLSENNISRIKTGNIKAIRWSTLEALCRELDCQPGDLLEYVPDPELISVEEEIPVKEAVVSNSARMKRTAFAST